ncbi:MAG: hypothetical protein A2580_14335 [Hydrogenophilales bacterium RIFOXYD1_FULL_62_11]|nr:MAG: hypothetical protein A2580_14335 [Hydrogenophilales bacterium RIFOXYD1_FULL_62_11]
MKPIDRLVLALQKAITELEYCQEKMGNDRKSTRAAIIAEAVSAVREWQRNPKQEALMSKFDEVLKRLNALTEATDPNDQKCATCRYYQPGTKSCGEEYRVVKLHTYFNLVDWTQKPGEPNICLVWQGK